MEPTGVPPPRLTPRERRIYHLAAQGKPAKEIASALAISARTVKFHLANIYRKAGVSGQVELILRHGAPTAGGQG